MDQLHTPYCYYHLLSQAWVNEIHKRPKIINHLFVTIWGSRKIRLVVRLWKLKREDIAIVNKPIDHEHNMFKFDLTFPYHHFEILEEHRKYARFRFFQFCVLPFGLSSAPFIFTKLLNCNKTLAR